MKQIRKIRNNQKNGPLAYIQNLKFPFVNYGPKVTQIFPYETIEIKNYFGIIIISFF